MTNFPTPTDDRLDEADDRMWQAYQYIEGELPEADEAAFEQRLADDQSLRELVARVVATCSAVHAVEADVADTRTLQSVANPATEQEPIRPSARDQVTPPSTAWMVMAVAVAVLLVAVFMANPPRPATTENDETTIARDDSPPATDVADPDDALQAGSVLAFWANGRTLVDDEDGLTAADGHEPLSDEAFDEDLSVPGWMFAALEPERMEEMMESTDPEMSRN